MHSKLQSRHDRQLKVKTFSDTSVSFSHLDKDVNDFIAGVDLIDIKVSSSARIVIYSIFYYEKQYDRFEYTIEPIPNAPLGDGSVMLLNRQQGSYGTVHV